MVHARVSEAYIYFALMYMTDHIFPVLAIKDLINDDNDPTTPFKLTTGTKPSISHLRVLFFHLLYGKLLHILGQRRKICVTKHKRVLVVYSLEFHSIKSVSCVCTKYKEDNILIWCCFLWKFLQWVIIYVTTLFRSNGYESGSDVYTFSYIFEGRNWQYNHVHIVWGE